MARRIACRGSWSHIRPRPRIGGNDVKPSVRKRWTRPPSWSTAISSGSLRTSWMRAVNSHSVCLSWKLRANRMTPPTSGWRRRFFSSLVSTGPATSTITGPGGSDLFFLRGMEISFNVRRGDAGFFTMCRPAWHRGAGVRRSIRAAFDDPFTGAAAGGPIHGARRSTITYAAAISVSSVSDTWAAP